MKRLFILACGVLVVSAAAFGQSMMSTGSTSSGTGSMTAPATADPKVGAELRFAKSTGRKIIYTTLEDAEALAAKSPVVLFFAADWCPFCQQDLRDINANGSTLKDIAIVVVDYDKERALKKQYGVTVQDTFVQIRSDGSKVIAWNGGGVAMILSRVVRA